MDDLHEFFGPNAGYALELYERYLADPDSLDPETKARFAGWSPTMLVDSPPSESPASPSFDVGLVTRVANLARTIRGRGHLAAQLDPLGTEPRGDSALEPDANGLSAQEMRALPPSVIGGPVSRSATNAAEAIEALRRVYCSTTGYDFAHIEAADERDWLCEAAESSRFRPQLDEAGQRKVLDRLTEVEAFELFLQRSLPNQRRFSIEGTDMMVPMMDTIVRAAAATGTREVAVGMAHRGRLNVLANVLGKPFGQILGEFQRGIPGPTTAPSENFAHYGWTGDVKYHLGAQRTVTEGTEVLVRITLAPNPSHLEFINPVVQGMTRAMQDDRGRPGPPRQSEDASLAILIHGDAAFPGEGVVAESLNLAQLAGYCVGGAIHIIANNQIGFTTSPRDARSTLYASDLAKGFEIPIVHVNADDPEACLAAARLAHAYRQRFHKDFLIDLVGYRRWGHNEADEPAFTQPVLYEKVRSHPTARALWARALAELGSVTQAESDEMLRQAMAALQEVSPEPDRPPAPPPPVASGVPGTTAVSASRLESYNDGLLAWPSGFSVHPKLERILKGRQGALAADGGLDWGHAESLAFASLLADGTPIRLAGQDAERGTFSQRHLVLHDSVTGARFSPLQALKEARASFTVCNSPLSENGALGFEFGYGVQAPEALVLWEAQYGDFANAGQVIIDQFISAARSKWRQTPWMVMLLPHGYEGQGPEHSSGRLERYLQLAGDDNLRIANCTTAAQYFHLLRRQVALRESDPRPLILMTPKSLLRHKLAFSTLDDLTSGAFQPILDDQQAVEHRDQVTRVILCSGKVYVDLVSSGARAEAPRVAVARVEQLCPFPAAELNTLLAGYPHVREIVWLQEEPRNMGAWSYMAPRLRDLIGRDPSVDYIGRPDHASPAAGSGAVHQAEQARIVAGAFTGLQGPLPVSQGVTQHAG
ncbi:MAG TPA: 2-oxoglutarate dehydrogenase E1 component [Chloroflexota bacterium]|nr:2-oxoglutarate dehydrogenase E1 component [Chloroflexota bacterium]